MLIYQTIPRTKMVEGKCFFPCKNKSLSIAEKGLEGSKLAVGAPVRKRCRGPGETGALGQCGGDDDGGKRTTSGLGHRGCRRGKENYCVDTAGPDERLHTGESREEVSQMTGCFGLQRKFHIMTQICVFS